MRDVLCVEHVVLRLGVFHPVDWDPLGILFAIAINELLDPNRLLCVPAVVPGAYLVYVCVD